MLTQLSSRVTFNLRNLLLRSRLQFFCTDKKKSRGDKPITIELNDEKTEFPEQKQDGEKNDPFKAVFYNKKQRNKKRELLKKDITTNPEFFNAFPHLKQIAFPDRVKNGNTTFETTEQQFEESNPTYFDSLKWKYKDFDLKTDAEKVRENEQFFVDAYSRREGPKKFMSREEKDRIHHEIDLKMTELENTGLSKEEILLNEPVKWLLK